MVIGLTGATGGLGRRLTEVLADKGFSIKCLVRLESKAPYLTDDHITLCAGDITKPETLENFVRGIDVCIHVAAQVATAATEVLEAINVRGTENICEALERHNPNCRLIYCSSIVVKNYKPYKRWFVSNYTISKYKAEQIVDQYSDRLQTTVIYPGYIFGYYDRALFPYILKLLENGLDFMVRGGEQNAPLIFVDDLCDLFYRCVTNRLSVGKKYVSLEKSETGMHDVLRMVAAEKGYSIPDKVYSRIRARVVMRLRRISNYFRRTKKEVLPLRAINILSGRALYFNNAAELGWKHETPIHKAIQNALYWNEQNQQGKR